MTPPPSADPEAVAVELRGITKRFPGTLANDAVDLTVRRGEIHALMGENGAGKSTLMSVLYGMERPDAGSVRIDGNEVAFSDPGDAMAAGLGMVHQSFKLFDSLTVAENVVYAAEPRRFGLVDRGAARRRVRELAEEHGLAVDPDARVGELPVGLRQRVEILKLLHRGARTLILDEPTAVLTPAEADALFAVLKSLAAQGRTVILVTHKLREVLEGSDNVTVLRDGRVVARLVTAETSAAEIAAAMTGRAVELDRVHAQGSPGDAILDVTGLATDGARDVRLTVRAGEIVGIAGVAGNGQSELVEALAGLRPVNSGRVTLLGDDITHASATERRAKGLAYVPEDRHAVGTAPAASVADNLAMGHHRTSLSSRGLLPPAAVRGHARRLIERFGIKAASPEVPASVAVRRQSAEAAHRARTRPRRPAVARRAAHTRRRHRRRPEHPRPADRLPRRRPRRPARLGRAERDPRARGPGPGDVRGPRDGVVHEGRGGRADARARDGGRRRQLGSGGPDGGRALTWNKQPAYRRSPT